jgi:PAS domain S-box-containing protein
MIEKSSCKKLGQRIKELEKEVAKVKQVETALQESEKKYRNLFKNSQIGIFQSRIDGSEIVAVNQKFADIYGYSKEELIGKPSAVVWHDPNVRENALRQLKETGQLVNYEAEFIIIS